VVPVVDLARRGARYADEFARAAEAIARRGTFLLGPELDAFEAELGGMLGTETVGVSSGAAALQLILAAMGVGHGDEVVVPAFTAVPTAAAVCAVGATPVFADVDPTTACVTSESVAAVRTPRSKAVIVVHLYGFPAPLPDTDVPIVQDAAQALGAPLDLRSPVATALSFYPTKNSGGITDGGAVTTTHADLASEVRRRRVHGMTEQYVHEAVSQNFRMSELAAAWLRLSLPDLAADVARQRHIAATYRRAAPHLRWQAAHPHHAYHLCVFRHSQRSAVRKLLDAAGVHTSVHYPLSLDQQPAYRHFVRVTMPTAASWATECTTLPCFPELTDDEVDTVADALRTQNRGTVIE
jgi:dTDP-4-amino-4,6-dideoxygalactose transaminase